MADSSEKSESERDLVLLLIALYRDSPELWKVKSKDYFNQAKKQIAMNKIVDALISFKPDFTVDKLKKKINTLRTNFNKDYRAIENAKRSGAATSDIPKPKSWYYEEMLFIRDQLEIAETDSSETDAQSSQAVQAEEGLPADCPTPQRKRTKKNHNSTEELVGLASAYFKKPETEADIVAKGWAFKLSRLPADQRKFAEKIINDTLFEADLGNLTRHGVHFISSNNSSIQPVYPPSHSQTPMLRSPCSTPSNYGSTTPSPAMSPSAGYGPHNASQTYIGTVPEAETPMNVYRMEYIPEHSQDSLRQPQEQSSTAAEYITTFTSF